MVRKQKFSFHLRKINFVSLACLLIIGAICFANISYSATADFEESIQDNEALNFEVESKGLDETTDNSDIEQEKAPLAIETPVEPKTTTTTVGLDFSLKRLILEVTNHDVIANYPRAKKIFGGFYMIDFDSVEATKKAYIDLSTVEGILSVTPDIKVHSLAPDTNQAQAFGSNTTSYISWGAQKVGTDLYTKWNTLAGNNNEVKVSVIDSGINKEHNVFNGNRVVLTQSTKNYITGNASPADDNGHGTAVAGIIAESTPDTVKIYPSKVLDSEGYTSESTGLTDILFAIANAVDEDKVNIINLSLGVGGKNGQAAPSCNEVNSFFRAVKDEGVLVIAAAGNDGARDVSFPANCDDVVAVSAVDSDFNFASSYSNYGPEIDFAMPGSNMNVAWVLKENETSPAGVTNKNVTAYGSGTSFAAPYLTAAAAQIKTEHPDYTPQQIVTTLKQNAIEFSDTERYGYGVVNFKTKMFNTPRMQATTRATDWTKSDTMDIVFVSANPATSYAITTGNSGEKQWLSYSSPVKYDQTTIYNIDRNDTITFWIQTDTNHIAYASAEVKYIDRLSPNFVSGPKVYDSDTDNVTVGADILDSQSGLKNATLYYRKKSSSDNYASTSKSFNNVNTQASARFALSDLADNAEYEAYITAKDKLDNESRSANFTIKTAAATILPDASSNNTQPTIIPETVKTSTTTNVEAPRTEDVVSASVSVFALSSATAIVIYYFAARRRH